MLRSRLGSMEKIDPEAEAAPETAPDEVPEDEVRMSLVPLMSFLD